MTAGLRWTAGAWRWGQLTKALTVGVVRLSEMMPAHNVASWETGLGHSTVPFFLVTSLWGAWDR